MSMENRSCLRTTLGPSAKKQRIRPYWAGKPLPSLQSCIKTLHECFLGIVNLVLRLWPCPRWYKNSHDFKHRSLLIWLVEIFICPQAQPVGKTLKRLAITNYFLLIFSSEPRQWFHTALIALNSWWAECWSLESNFFHFKAFLVQNIRGVTSNILGIWASGLILSHTDKNPAQPS